MESPKNQEIEDRMAGPARGRAASRVKKSLAGAQDPKRQRCESDFRGFEDIPVNAIERKFILREQEARKKPEIRGRLERLFQWQSLRGRLRSQGRYFPSYHGYHDTPHGLYRNFP